MMDVFVWWPEYFVHLIFLDEPDTLWQEVASPKYRIQTGQFFCINFTQVFKFWVGL